MKIKKRHIQALKSRLVVVNMMKIRNTTGNWHVEFTPQGPDIGMTLDTDVIGALKLRFSKPVLFEHILMEGAYRCNVVPNVTLTPNITLTVYFMREGVLGYGEESRPA